MIFSHSIKLQEFQGPIEYSNRKHPTFTSRVKLSIYNIVTRHRCPCHDGLKINGEQIVVKELFQPGVNRIWTSIFYYIGEDDNASRQLIEDKRKPKFACTQSLFVLFFVFLQVHDFSFLCLSPCTIFFLVLLPYMNFLLAFSSPFPSPSIAFVNGSSLTWLNKTIGILFVGSGKLISVHQIL